MSNYYILHTDERLNPTTGNGDPYFTNGKTVAYVLIKDGAKTPVAYTSYGSFGLAVGQTINMVADQSGRRLGRYRVLGIRHADGTLEGNVPNRALRWGVAK